MILKGDICVDPRNNKECYVVNRDIPGGTLVTGDFFDPINNYPKIEDGVDSIFFARKCDDSGIVEFFIKGDGWVY